MCRPSMPPRAILPIGAARRANVKILNRGRRGFRDINMD